MEIPDNHGRMTGRRSFLAAVAAMPLALAACTAKPKPASAPQASGSGFPVQLEHAFGTTTVKSAPQRIVALGSASADVCLALGIVPVGMTDASSTSWFMTALRKVQGATPFLLDFSLDVPVDNITNLAPDLILAVNANLSRDDYDQLAKIAPVVAAPSASLDTDWQTSVAVVGKALGLVSAAADLTKATEDKISSSVSDYPGLKGATVLFVGVSTVTGADLRVYQRASNPMRLFAQWGLQPAPSLASAAAKARGTQSVPPLLLLPQSAEPTLASDIFVASVNQSELRKVISSPLLETVPAAKTESVYYIAGDENASLQSGSPLGIQWACDNVVPELAKFAYHAQHPVR